MQASTNDQNLLSKTDKEQLGKAQPKKGFIWVVLSVFIAVVVLMLEFFALILSILAVCSGELMNCKASPTMTIALIALFLLGDLLWLINGLRRIKSKALLYPAILLLLSGFAIVIAKLITY